MGNFLRQLLRRAPGLSRIAAMASLPAHLRPVARAQGMITMKQAQCLYLLARDTSVGYIVEVGNYRGRSTIALALGIEAGNHDTPVYAIDPHEPFGGCSAAVSARGSRCLLPPC